MTNQINLVSVQPIMKNADPIQQWHYYESLLLDYFTNNITDTSEHPTFISLPEYAFGNKTNYSESKIERLKELVFEFAKVHQIYIIAGSYAHFENEKWFNRSLTFDYKNGKIFSYDKKFLFNFELKNSITPGTNDGIFILNGLKIKILICSDLWFPEEIRDILQEKIDLLVVPAMAVVKARSLVDYGKFLWQSLAMTRSRENVIPMIVSDWAVQPFGESFTSGVSSIFDPSIRWQSDTEFKQAFNRIETGEEGVISTTISLEKIEEYRKYRKEVGLLPKT